MASKGCVALEDDVVVVDAVSPCGGIRERARDVQRERAVAHPRVVVECGARAPAWEVQRADVVAVGDGDGLDLGRSPRRAADGDRPGRDAGRSTASAASVSIVVHPPPPSRRRSTVSPSSIVRDIGRRVVAVGVDAPPA